MSIVIAKKIDGKIVMCSDSASFRDSRRVSDSAKKIHKVTDDIYFGCVGDVVSMNVFMDKFKLFYEESDETYKIEYKPVKIPNEQELRDMLLSIYSVMTEDKLITSSANFSIIVVVARDVYQCTFTKDDFEIAKINDDEISRGIAIGMYTENIGILLNYMHPEEVIIAIYNDGGIYVNNVIQEVVI